MGTVSAEAGYNNTKNQSDNLTVPNSQVMSDYSNSTSNNSSTSKNYQTFPNPQIYRDGVPVARGGHPEGYVFDTITHAITDAEPGDTIMIVSDVYFEHITVTKNLDFRLFSGQATFTNRATGPMITINPGVTATFQNIAIITGVNVRCQGIINNGFLTLENCGFTLNSADFGGAIDNEGTLTVKNCDFSRNYANNQGGAIFNNGTCTVINSIFTENNADILGVGGAINNGGTLDKKASLNVMGCTFNNNSAYHWGGAICNNYDGTCNIDDCIFNSNAANQGGAICNNWGTTTITDSAFAGNSASNGGAFYNGQGSCSLTGSNIISNSASKGGAIFNNIGSMTAQFNRFIGNSAYSYEDGKNIFGRTNARYNWWGSNNGPSGTNNYYVDDSNWLVLSLFLLDSSSQEIPPYSQITSLMNGGTAKILANLLYDVNGSYYNPASGHVPNGIPITFATDWGTLSTTSTTLNNGQAVTTFTANGVLPAIAHISTIVDTPTVTKSLNILNSPPVLNPIGNKEVNEEQTLSFTTTGSDYEGETLSYSATGLPAGASYDPNTGVFTWTPTFDQAGDYTITFTVSAGTLSDSETLTITVNNVNRAPVANTGSDQTVNRYILVNLDGSSSSDPDGDSLTYTWILNSPAGSSATLSNQNSANPSFTPDILGTYQLQLTVVDIYGATSTNTVTITAINRAPVANAGSDQTVYCNNLVNLDGSSSSDPDDDTLNYNWSLTRPAGSSAVLSNPNSISPSFTTDLPGSYQLQLIVTDIYGATSTSTMTVTVNKIPTTLTVNNARGNKGETVPLKATLKDNNGNPLFDKKVEFRVNGVKIGENNTDADGIATFNYKITQLHGIYIIKAVFNGETQYRASDVTGELYVPKADLYIKITLSKNSPKVGETFTLTYKLGNNGPDAAENVTITIPLPKGFEVSNISGNGWTYNAATNTITWTLEKVPVGDPYLYITGKLTSSGSYVFSSSISSETYNLNTEGVTPVTVNATNEVNAATNITSTVGMQETGIPLVGLILAILAIFSGLLTPKRK